MKDLDFDELDRAVNSVISNNPKPSDDLVAAETPAQPIPSLPVIPVVPIVPFVPSVPRPSTGRFMDVVHPSSDMRSTLVMPERAQDQVILAPIVQPPTNPTMPVDDKDDDSDIDQISNDINKTLGQTFNESQDSPFLSGAKVDKRPLGAFSAEQTATTSFNPVMTTTQFGAAGKSTDEKIVEINTTLPAELQNDLLSIEANDTVQIEEPEATIVPETSQIIDTPPVADISQISIVKDSVLTSAPESVPVSATSTSTSTSIPQQYTERPSTGDKDSGAIYDTNAYHKAMVSPVKKKSGWKWIIWIALLMIASVGAGLAVYFFVLPRL